MQIRCSALPRIMACPASAQPPKIKIDGDSEPARMGTAVHEVLAQVVTEGLDAVPNLEPTIKKYRVDRDELRMLAWFGLNTWQSIRAETRVVAVEEHLESEEFSGLTVTGSPDVICAHEDTIVVVDFKSGWIERNYEDQLMGYLFLAAQHYPSYTGYKRICVWLRTSEVDTVNVAPQELDDWAERLAERVQQTETYDPSPPACEFCPRAHECTARRVMIEAAMKDMCALVDGGGQRPETLAEVYPFKKLIDGVLKMYDGMLKTVLKEGPLPVGDGRMISLEDVQRDYLYLDRIAKPLMVEFGCKDLPDLIETLGPDAVTVPKKTIQDIAGMAAFKGEKGQAKKEIIENLRHADAIVTRTSPRLTLKKETSHG